MQLARLIFHKYGAYNQKLYTQFLLQNLCINETDKPYFVMKEQSRKQPVNRIFSPIIS